MTSPGESGETEPGGLSFDTGEMRAVTGGDSDTGVVNYRHYSTGSAATSEHVSVDPIAEYQFPSQELYFGD